MTNFNTETKCLTFQATTPYNTTVAEIRQGDVLRIMTKEGKVLLDTTAAEAGTGDSVILSDSFEMPSGGNVIIQNLSATGSGFRYENCVARNNRSRGLLIQGLNGTVTQCTLENNGMAGILVAATLKDAFSECGYAENLMINNNLIRGNGYYGSKKEYSAITVISDSASLEDPACQNHKNITIQHNTIENRYSKYAIYVNGAQSVKILNNTFGARNQSVNCDYPNDTATPVSINGTTDIEVSDNQYPAGTEVKVILSSTVVNAYGTDLGKMSSGVVSSNLTTSYKNGQWYVILTLKNLTESVQTGTWKTVSPQEMFGAEISGTFELNSGETKSFSIPVEKTALELNEPDDLAEVTVAHCVTGCDNSYNTLQLSFAFAPKINQTITIDGNADENVWANANILAMNRKNQTSVLTGWKGTDDLSAEIKLLWDDNNLYFYAEVTDDVHSEPQTGDSIWLGDSFQAAFSPDGSSNYAEIGWALGDDGTVYSYCWTNLITGTTQGENGIIEGGNCAVRRDEGVKKTYYEVSIPWSFIGLNGQAPEESSNIHFAMILNDNDGSGRRGYMNIFDGIGQGKDPSKYGNLCMSGMDGQEELEHTYGKPVFVWAEDNTCKASITCANCGDVQDVNVTVTATTTEATCTEDGKTIYTATAMVGEESYTDTKEVVIPTSGHSFKNGKCTVCGEDDPNSVPTTPVKPGWVGWFERWLDSLLGRDDEKNECEHSYSSVVTEPTCTKKGYTTHTCEKCGDSYRDSYVDAIGHNYVNGVCENCGTKKYPGFWDWLKKWF